MTGTYQYPESVPPHQYPEQMPSAYPGMLPPPVPYPKRRRWPKIAATVLVAVALVAVAAVVVVAARRAGDEPRVLSDDQAKAAVQEYLTALTSGDDETVARHTLCGLYDEVKERRADLAVAGLAGDAFRKQFSSAEVVSIDKIVPWSTTQAQVLFTMKVDPAKGSTRGRQRPPSEEQQGIAQILVENHGPDQEALVCSYVLRTGGQY
ncbi:Rv0361 family membrane protein [Mycobacterium sp. NPDC003449]